MSAMNEKLHLVAGDTGPDIVISLVDANTDTPINLSDPGTVIELQLWESGSETVKASIPCQPIPGKANADGSIDLSGPYGAPGGGGRVLMRWSSNALSAAGLYKAQVVVTLADGVIQTTYDLVPIQVRERVSG